MEKLYFVSHGYLDGGRADWDAVGSLASLVRYAKLNNIEYKSGYEIIMTDYFKDGINHITGITDSVIIVADIPPEFLIKYYSKDGFKDVLWKIKNNNNKLVFIDHHPNSDDTICFLKFLESENLFYYFDIFEVTPDNDAYIPLDLKKCAAERVQYFLFKEWKTHDDEVFLKIRKYAHDQDFGLREIHEAFRITIVIGANFNNEKLIFSIADGIFWTDEFQNVYNEQNRLTQELTDKLKLRKVTADFKINSHTLKKNIIYALMPDDNRLKASAAAYNIFKNDNNADIIILLHRFPFISIRCPIKEKDISAAKIAQLFGGGGHFGAASVGLRDNSGWFPYRKATVRNFKYIINTINGIILERYN